MYFFLFKTNLSLSSSVFGKGDDYKEGGRQLRSSFLVFFFFWGGGLLVYVNPNII